MLRSRLAPSLLGLMLALALAGVPRGDARAAAAVDAWGWVVVRQPPLTGEPYTPVPRDQGNSSGGSNTVTRVTTGLYSLVFPGIWNGMDTTVHVTAFSSASRRCLETERHMANFSDIHVTIACNDASRDDVDSGFIVSVLGQYDQEGKIGYEWYDAPGGQDDLTPAIQFNSTGATNTVVAYGFGRYAAFLPGLGSSTDPGHVQVSPVFYLNGWCSVLGWTNDEGAARVLVGCYDGEGDPWVGQWQLTYMRRMGLNGPGERPAAYLLANQPTAAEYVPVRRWSSAARTPTVTRSGRGRYAVTLPGMGLGGAAQVTPFGDRYRVCTVSSIRRTELPQRIGVRCFDGSGAPANAKFLLTFTR